MGKLIRNGIEYGGGNGTDIFEVTQAEYDALVQAGTLVHNALYVITDAPNLNETAKQISYEGSTATVWDKVEANKTAIANLGTAVPITVNAGTLDLNNSIAIGKAVFISLNVKNVSNGGSNLTIASISNTYKPSTYASVIVLKDDTTLLSGWIDTNGSIVIQSTTLNNAKIVVFAQYLKA